MPTTAGTEFTDMKFGPDGKLYASTEDGRIFRYPVNTDGTLGTPQVITSLQTANGGANRLISGFAFDPASTASNLKIWVSNTFYALSGATNGQNFTGKLTVMSGPNLADRDRRRRRVTAIGGRPCERSAGLSAWHNESLFLPGRRKRVWAPRIRLGATDRRRN